MFYIASFSIIFLLVILVKVVTDKIKEGIMKGCHEGIYVSSQSRVLSGDFGRDKMGAMADMVFPTHFQILLKLANIVMCASA